MKKEDEPDFRQVIKKFNRFSLLRRLYCGRIVEKSELHAQQLPVLEYIQAHDGCTQVELAKACCVTTQSIAISTKRMSNAGLISKKTDEKNLRCNKLAITDKGRIVAKQSREAFDTLDKRTFENISEEEMSELCRLLDKLIENLSDEEIKKMTSCELRNMMES